VGYPRPPIYRHDDHARECADRAKALGKNVLVDRDALDDVVRAVELRPGGQSLEIGLGIGTLTAALLDAVGVEIVVVEFDEDLARVLEQKRCDG